MEREPIQEFDALPMASGTVQLDSWSRRDFLSAVMASPLASAFFAEGHLVAQGVQQEAEAQKKKAEMLANIPTAEPRVLMEYLDADFFQVRREAYNRLYALASADIAQKGKTPFWFEELNKGKGSAERQRREKELQESMHHLERECMLVGTYCDLPKEPRTLHEHLQAFSRVTKRPMQLSGDVVHRQESLALASGGLWDVVRSVRLQGGKRLSPYASTFTGVHFSVLESDQYLVASDGALYACYNVDSGVFQVTAEPKLDLQSYTITAINLQRGNGSIEEMRADPRPPSPHAATFKIPKMEKGDTVHVTLACQSARVLRYSVTDIEKESSLVTPQGLLHYSEVAKEADVGGSYGVTFQTPLGAHETFKRLQCVGFNAKQEPIVCTLGFSTIDTMRMDFRDERPQSFLVYHPEVQTITNSRTFSFRKEK